MGVATKMDSLRSRLNYEPQVLGFGTSGRRGKVVDLTQLEVYLNALAELEYLQSLPPQRAASSGAKSFISPMTCAPAPASLSARRKAGERSPRPSSRPSSMRACRR